MSTYGNSYHGRKELVWDETRAAMESGELSPEHVVKMFSEIMADMAENWEHWVGVYNNANQP